MGSSAIQMPVVDIPIIRSGKCLLHQQALILPISREEVHVALLHIDDQNSPGCDGFNAFFFKKNWPIIGDEVTEAFLFTW